MTAAPRSLHLIASTDRRGAETFGVQLVEQLSATGTAAAVRALSDAGLASRHAVPVVPGDSLSRRVLALRGLAAQADVVAAHGSTTLPACAVGLLGTGVPFVYRSIGDPSWWVGSSRLKRLRTELLLRRAARVVVLWPGAVDPMADRFGVARERIDVIPNAVPVIRFLEELPDRREARTRLGIDPEVPLVAYVGSLTPEKDPVSAVEAVLATPGLHLVVVGIGPLEERIRRRTAGTPDRMHLLGTLADVRPVYAAADVLVVPSRTEGIPAVVLEAGLAGVPAVATSVGGLPSVIDDGETGLLVGRDELERLPDLLHEAISRRGALGTAARQRYRERYDLTDIAERWAASLRRAVAGNRSPTRRG